MTQNRNTLVLHLAGVAEPIWIALAASDDAVSALDAELPTKLLDGAIEQIATADGGTFTINFAHVVAAHLAEAPPMASPYGAAKRRRD